jgi:hypothetical protein
MASSSEAQKLVGLKKFVVVKIKTKKETRYVAMTSNNEGTLFITPLEILDESEGDNTSVTSSSGLHQFPN